MPYHPTIVVPWNPSTTGLTTRKSPNKKRAFARCEALHGACSPTGVLTRCPMLREPGVEVNAASRSRLLGSRYGTAGLRPEDATRFWGYLETWIWGKVSGRNPLSLASSPSPQVLA
jgi:hypothetical protein